MKKKRIYIIGNLQTGDVIFFMIALAVFISVFAEIIIPSYHTNPLLYGALGALAGLFFKGESK